MNADLSGFSPVVIHSDHCAAKLLPWFDGEFKLLPVTVLDTDCLQGMLEANEAYFKINGEPLFSFVATFFLSSFSKQLS